MELRQPLQTGQFVNHEPDWFLVRHGLIQESQDQRVDPEADERAEGFAHGRARGNEYPATPRLSPFGGRPDRGCLALFRKQPKAICTHIEGAENTSSLLRGFR